MSESRFPALRSIPTQPIAVLDVDRVPVRIRDRTPVGSFETFVCSKINGIRSITDLAALVDVSIQEMQHVLAGMIGDGIVVMTKRRALRRVDPRMEPTPVHGYVDFADVFEDLSTSA